MSLSTRRNFLKRLGLVGATTLTAPWIATGRPRASRSASTVKIRGRVTDATGGLQGVAVTDGVTVTQTDADGRFQLVAAAHRPFVYLSVPAGYRFPTHETGTARIYEPLDATSGKTMEVEFQLRSLDRDDDHHAFLALTDPQMGVEEEVEAFRNQTVPDVRQTLQELDGNSVFGVGGGDLVFDNLPLLSGYEAAVREMGIPFVQVVGNHDLDFEAPDDPGSTATYRRHFGPEYYSFDRGAVHYVVLDDVYWPGSDGFGNKNDDYLGHIDATQLQWLSQDLSFVEEGRTVIVLTHIPPLSTAYRRSGEESPPVGGMIINRDALYKLLDPYNAHIVAGHTHENEHRFESGPHEHVVGTVCGAWWTGPICHDGTPRGYAVYEVRGENVEWRYKSTGFSTDHQMRLYPPGADPRSPDEFIANVWDADDQWTVVWYEDGIRTGEMAGRVGTDPLSRRLYEGPEKPDKNSWADPRPTDHLFYAPANTDANTIRVEATDRFGRTYTNTITSTTE